VAFVAMGGSRKLAHVRRRPQATVVFRTGWQWVAVEGKTSLAGPDDPLDGFDPAGFLSSCETSSPRPAARTRIGRPTTG
jgi:hypothetical protein